MTLVRTLLVEEFRLLTFRPVSAAIHGRWPAFLTFGLTCTWLAGIGRYWDHPRAGWWQTLGLGSLIYVFALALVLWLIVLPLKPRQWSYRNVLLFVTLTSPPALLYAIPVERFMPLEAASALNAWFLAIVAAWRVGLLFQFLKRVADLSWGQVIIASLLPLAAIVVTLTVLNLEHVVFDIMAGLHRENASSGDASYGVLMLVSMLSIVGSPILLLGYVIGIYEARTRIGNAQPADSPPGK